MRLGQDVLSDLGRALAVEWVLPNGLGGSASGTAAGALARRAQGLLVAGGSGRATALLLKLDERVSGAAGSFDLGCNLLRAGAARAPGEAGAVRLAGVERVWPHGHLLLEEFRLDPWPTWRWRAGDTVLEKTLFAIHGHDAVAVTYRHLDGPAVHLSASPLCVARGLDAPPSGAAPIAGSIHGVPGRVRIELADGVPALTLWHNGTFLPARVWMRDLAYPDEAGDAGGEAPREDVLVPGYAEGLVAPGQTFHVVCAAEDNLFKALASEARLGVPPPRTLAACVAALEAGERDRCARWRLGAVEGADFTARQAAAAHGGPGADVARGRAPLVDERDFVAVYLALALRAGLTRRGHRRTLVSTLPRAQERGADALQAVQALVSLRAFDLARDVLRGYVEYLDEGFAPEGFDPADGRPLYGDPAPSLWLVAAADLFARRSADHAFLADALHPGLDGLMQAFRQGTRHGVRVDADGLLAAGAGDGRAVKRADLNALWYHALVAMAQLSRLLAHRESGAFYLAWAREHQKRFNEVFWDEERGCLFESLSDAGPVRGLSPAQVLAASLPPALLPPERTARLVATLERDLLTPWGLRESPGSRTVSTAWLGPFVTARVRAHQRSAQSQELARGWIDSVLSVAPAVGHVPGTLCLGADGRPVSGGCPAGPAGDPASTLAAAELLRVWIEELDREPVPARETLEAG